MSDKIVNKKDNKFELVQIDERIFDSKFETKSTTYLQDALFRFRKNKASIIAFVILVLLILMSVVAPAASRYEINQTDALVTFLPPKIPGLEKLGIATGKKSQVVRVSELGNAENPNATYPEGTYKIIGEEYDDAGILRVKIELDLYAKAFGLRTLRGLTESEFNAIDPNIIDSHVKHTEVIAGYEITSYDVVVEYAKYLGFKDANSVYFYFGTDDAGRDLWVRLWSGTRVSLLIGLIVAIVNLSIGVVWGSISGYYGGKVDLIMERIIEIVSGIPWIAVMTIVVLYFGRNMGSILISLIMTSWIGTASMVRTQFYRYKGQEYVLAARTLGAKDKRIMTKHILPNAIGPIVTSSVLVIPSAVFFESTLSYLGLGLQNGSSVGILLAKGQAVGITVYPHLTLFPALVISILMIAFNMFGNGLRDALNPSLRGTE